MPRTDGYLKSAAGIVKVASLAPPRVRALVRRLVKHLAEGARPGIPTLLGADKVILDMEVDGVRCLLLRPRPGALRLTQKLSPREQEIARMVAEGYPNKAIGAVLDISTWTVSTHLRRMFAKAGVRSRTALVVRLMEEDVVIEAPERATAIGRSE